LDKKPVSFGTFSPNHKTAMFNAKYIAQYSVNVHADNRAKGFGLKPRSSRVMLGLIASEMFEAFEALRKGHYADKQGAKFLLDLLRTNETTPEAYGESYAKTVKDTLEAELAGTCIRCFDSIGNWLLVGGGYIQDNETRLDLRSVSEYAAAKIDSALEFASSIPFSSDEERAENLTLYVLSMAISAQGIQTGGEQLGYLTPLAAVVDTLKNMALLAAWFNIDLLMHIELELAYNRTRPIRHGKLF
jgi:hypothetical protein